MAEANPSAAVKIAWVKLGKVWWPGYLVNEADYTDPIKYEVSRMLAKSKKGGAASGPLYAVKFFNEDNFEVARNANNKIFFDVDEEKRDELVKKGIAGLKSPAMALPLAKFKTDVLEAERIVNPSGDLTNLMRLLDGQEKKPAAARAVAMRIPPPLPIDAAKKYHCGNCPYTTDRVNVIAAHIKYCKAATGGSTLVLVNRQAPSGPPAAPQAQNAAASTSTAKPSASTGSAPAAAGKKVSAPVVPAASVVASKSEAAAPTVVARNNRRGATGGRKVKQQAAPTTKGKVAPKKRGGAGAKKDKQQPEKKARQE